MIGETSYRGNIETLEWGRSVPQADPHEGDRRALGGLPVQQRVSEKDDSRAPETSCQTAEDGRFSRGIAVDLVEKPEDVFVFEDPPDVLNGCH